MKDFTAWIPRSPSWVTEQGRYLSPALQKTGGLFVLKMCVDDSEVDTGQSKQGNICGKVIKELCVADLCRFVVIIMNHRKSTRYALTSLGEG